MGAQDVNSNTIGSNELGSSGLGPFNKNGQQNYGMRNSLNDVQMMVRGSMLSSAEDPYQAAQKNPVAYNDDLTLEMLGGPTAGSAMSLRP